MKPKNWYSQSGGAAWQALLGMTVALWLALALACSDDKPKSGHAQETTGNESGLDRAKDRVDTAHEKFKEEIRPAAGWVDEKSHRVVDEAESAVKKGKNKLEGDDEHDHDHDHDQDHDKH